MGKFLSLFRPDRKKDNRKSPIGMMKFSIANKIKSKYLRRNREDARKFNRQQKKKLQQICKGKKLSNDNTDHMVVDQARTVHFEEGISINILSRLSVRSLHQCKCVSKYWNRLISDPYFKMKHLKHAKNDPNSQRFLITQRCPNRYNSYCCPISSIQMVEDVQKLDRPLHFKRLFRAYCSCDGFIVVIAYDFFKHPIHLLWNPSIRESVVLPAPEFEIGENTRYGFGYDSTSGDYKILRICDQEYNEILALKSGSWRKIDKHPHVVSNVVSHTSCLAFVHEAFHWIGSSRNLRSLAAFLQCRPCHAGEYTLVSFSISKEVYGEIPLPEQILSFVGIIYLDVLALDGMLCVYSSTCLQGFETYKFWVLKDYGVEESWSAFHTLEDPSISRVMPRYKFADGELLFFCLHRPSRQMEFRTSSGPFMPWLEPICHHIVPFTESLISPESLVSYV